MGRPDRNLGKPPMSYRFAVDESAAAGLRRIVREQLDEILGELEDESLSVHERVHSARKHCKKVRGLLRLVRPGVGGTYREENEAVRDAGQLLSALRDSQTRIDAFDKVMDNPGGELFPDSASAIRDGLVDRREELVSDESDVADRLNEFRRRIEGVRQRVHAWKIKGNVRDVIGRGLKRTYARGRQAMRAAYNDSTPEAFHQWRKRVKDYWMHLLLLEEFWPPVLKAYSDQAKELSDLLGEDHDLAVISEELQAEPDDFGGKAAVDAFVALADRRRERLQSEARPLGRRLFLAKPNEAARYFRNLWEAWKNLA